jgi:glycine betaine catabolism A
MFPLAPDRTTAACERTRLSMSSRAYRRGGVLVPSEHHISEVHAWVGRHA